MSDRFAATLEAFDRVVAGHDDITRKGKATPYTAMNGNMFAFVTADGALCVRLSDADREAFNAEHDGEPVLQYGRVMRGYVAVPDALAADEKALAELYGRAVDHARTLKPKPTRRK